MSFTYLIQLLKEKRPHLKAKSVKELNRRVKFRKRVLNRVQVRLDKISLRKIGEIEKLSETQMLEKSVEYNSFWLGHHKQEKKSLRRKRQPSKKAYFGRGI